jgi:hypothetical protein
MHSVRTKLLFIFMLELHPTSFNNKFSHENIIENTQMSIQKKKKEKKDEKKCKLQKKKENKVRTGQYY